MTKAAAKIPAPHKANVWMLPTNPELDVASFANWGRLTKTKASMTTPSKMRSTMMVAREAEIGTPSFLFKMTARSTSPARAG